jgi:hypothetical protein
MAKNKHHPPTQQELIDTFLKRMAAAGMPLERARQGHGRNLIYRITSGEKEDQLIRLRTASAPFLIAKATGFDWRDPINLESGHQDYVGSVQFNRATGEIGTFLIPKSRVIEDLRDGHREATEALGRPSRSDVRILYFDKQEDIPKRHHGFADKYAAFGIPPVEGESATAHPVQLEGGSHTEADDALLEALDEEVRDREQECIRRGIYSTRMVPQIVRFGVVQAMVRHLEHDSFGHGRDELDDLVEAGYLHLTVESSVLNPKYASLFTDGQRRLAWSNLFGPHRIARSQLMHDLGGENHGHEQAGST